MDNVVIGNSIDKCQVMLVSPIERRHHAYLPFALLYLASFLESKNIRTKIVDIKEVQPLTLIGQIKRKPTHEEYINQIKQELSASEPAIVGVSCYTAEYNSVMRLIQILKKHYPLAVFVVGGVHATLQVQDFLFAESPVDFAVVGDGENPLLEIWKQVCIEKKQVCHAQGVAWFDSTENKVVSNGCNIETDLETKPAPAYEKIDIEHYVHPRVDHVRWLPLAGVQIFTGRGCPYSCEFCAVNYIGSLNSKSRSMRYRAIKDVVDEITALQQNYAIDGFYIIDDCFMVDKDRTAQFCHMLIERKCKLIWGAETRANLIIGEEKLLKLMKQAGCIQLDFGVESGSEKLLKTINKKLTVSQIQQAFALCRKLKIRTYANILFNIPGETEEDIDKTFRELQIIKPSVVGCGTLVPLLGSPIYDKFVMPKLTRKEYEIYNKNVYEEIVDPRFKLAFHTLDLRNIVRRLNARYGALRTLPLSYRYWSKILSSKWLAEYLKYFMALIGQLILQPMFFQLQQRVPAQFYKPVLAAFRKLRV